jgi:MoaA/NifB/PqqE/SkfB family radical SAM enzyme
MWSTDTLEWIDIELTSFCNISCKGCFRVISKQADQILNKTYIDLETIKKRFQKEMFPNIRIINFCGSVDEPTTHPEFFEIIDHFADWNCHINIATNGSLRTAKWWAELARRLPPSHRVTWGIDGSDELSEVYREGSNFKKVEQNYRAFISEGGQAVWQFIVFEHNEHQLEEAKQKAKDEGFRDFKTIISHRKDSKGVTPKKELKKADDNPKEQTEEPCISCKYGNQKRIFVNHMGNVIPCCHLNSKMMEYSVTGSIKDEFEQILADEDYINDINLQNVSIEQALNGKVFTDIIDSWTSNNKIPRCVSVCALKDRDKFIKEKL